MKKTGYLFGSKSLLIQCYQVIQSQNIEVKAVVSDDVSIINWATNANLAVYSVADQEQLISLGAVDFIFSITHLKIIPSSVLKLANNIAINFHDGLLPGYAGLNVTTWAIYNQEKEHGITWHEMTDAVDEGHILKQVKFEIDATETAFTLNAKCYEAALTSFSELMQNIADNSLTKLAQDAGESVFYRGCQRIPRMAILDWQCDVEKIDATIRALHFGPYSNPISLPKILLNEHVFYVHEAKICNTATGQPNVSQPGQVMSLNSTLEISAKNGVVSFTSIMDSQGNTIDVNELINQSSIKVGDILPAIDQMSASELTQLDETFCKYEDNWLQQLQTLNQLVPSTQSENAESADKPSYAFSTQNITPLSAGNLQTMQSYLTLFFARLTCQSAFNLFFQQPEENKLKRLMIESCVPIEFDIDFSNSIADVVKSTEQKLIQRVDNASYSKDLINRHPELKLNKINKTLVITEVENNDSINLCTNAGLVLAINKQTADIIWHYNEQSYSANKITQLQTLFTAFLENAVSSPQSSLADTSLLSNADYNKLINEWNQTNSNYNKNQCVHQLFEKQVETAPTATALSFSGAEITYEELNQRANQVAHYLISKNLKPDQLVGVLLDRSIDMIVCMMGVLKSGAAYLPLDPTYPKDRIEYMLEDAQVAAVITQNDHVDYLHNISVNVLFIDTAQHTLTSFSQTNPITSVSNKNLVYTIYTSGSTGKPKGVMVEHANVANFFHGMNNVITDPHGVWLAVTSISFDISVLEIFWTLASGYELALFSDAQRKSSKKMRTAYPNQDIEFSLFYWNVADDESEYDDDPYRLLMESAKFGDKNNFKAVWTPERHFHSFGGLYPNPSVTSAALAAITENIHIRAGSCVVPLHHPIRIAEDWSMIDNISKGRTGIAIAAGWQPNDFVIMPQNFADAKNVMFESAKTVQKLWRGETLEFTGHDGKEVKVRTLPRPVQKNLPIWVTTAGNPETFRQAGEIGGNILTHLLGQTVEEVAVNIKIYREAYKKAGHAGEGHVTLLLHTLVGDDDEKVKDLARAPMKKYLKSAMFLVKAAAWNFPTFKALSEETGQTLDEFFENISDEDFDGILEFAFLRYYETSGLFGTPERCLAMVDRVKEIGVNEIGCLIDYGLDTENVLKHLPQLNNLRKISIKQAATETTNDLSIADIIASRNVTHLQCTPSMASMLVADNDSAEKLNKIKHIMIGGEAFPMHLAKQLTSKIQNTVTNMYGPTETTIWSSTQNINADDQKIYIGKPIANTQLYVLDKFKKPVPVNTPGELYIAGDGVVRGYHRRADLSAEKFINNPFIDDSNNRMYSTGDLVQYNDAGVLECLGRIDHQIKIRGYRIELGEIESLLLNHDSISEAVVVLREDTVNDKRLVAYVVAQPNQMIDAVALKKTLAADLPEFMVPSIFVELKALPLTPNGKTDRNALPAPEQQKQTASQTSFVKPENALQESIVSCWQAVLNLEKIGLDDNFFDIGGHSLLVVEVLSKLRASIEQPVKMIDMFRFPTIRQFSDYLSDDSDSNSKLSESEDRAKARKDARKNTLNRRRARQK